jgi:hypothetical protein
VEVEYAKADPTHLIIPVTATNRGPDPAPLRVLHTLWFRNTWAWQRRDSDPSGSRPTGQPVIQQAAPGLLQCQHALLGEYWLACDGAPELAFTENESNAQRLWGTPNRTGYVKDGINNWIVHARTGAVNPEKVGTKAAAHHALSVAADASERVLLRLSRHHLREPFADAELILGLRQTEADAFYDGRFGAQACRRMSDASSIRRSPACCGATSSTTTKSNRG